MKQMKKIKWALLSASFVCVVALCVLLWKYFISNDESSKYRSEKILRGDIVQTVSASGTLNPVILVNVGTQISGRVQKIFADFNDHVKAGQILLELDPQLLDAVVLQSEAALRKADTSLELAKANEERGEALRQKGFISHQDYDKLIQTRKAAIADLELAKAQLVKDKTNLNYATIISPVSGVVVDREVDVGQTVASSFQTPVLFKIAQDLKKMQIDSSFAEADIGNIRPGQIVDFTVDAFPDRTFKGMVRQIRLNPTTQQNVVTYDVVIAVENPDGILLPGMTAYVNIETAEHKNVLLASNAALRFRPKKDLAGKNTPQQTPGKGTLFKVEGKTLKPVQCRLGITDNRSTEIISDQLKVGDEVVVGDALEDPKNPANSFRIRTF